MLLELSARGFRNLEPLEFRPLGGAHLLMGDNGAGKTSLLEAIYLLATTRSFRTSNIADCRRHDAEGLYLTGDVRSPSGARAQLRISLVGAERQRAVNGSTTTLSEHLEVLPVVAWSGAETDLLTGSPRPRRRFMDRGVVSLSPSALEHLSRYRKALGHKRELLHRGNASQLRLWNRMVATAAAKVTFHRQRYVQRLETAFATVLQDQGLGFADLQLRYRPSPAWPTMAAPQPGSKGATATELPSNSQSEPLSESLSESATVEQLEAHLLDRFEEASSQELRRGIPMLGPHRDDLRVVWSSRGLRRVASAGERKAVTLALVAAHGRVLEAAGERPVYLLDDLDAELSESTLEAVWKGFSTTSQLFASSNRPEVWKRLSLAGIHRLRRGVLSTDSDLSL